MRFVILDGEANDVSISYSSVALRECRLAGDWIEVSQETAENLRLLDGETYTITCGGRTAAASLRVVDTPGHTAALSPNLREKLLVPSVTKTNVRLGSGRAIRIGPVAGVFVSPYYLEKVKTCDGQTGFARFLRRANDEADLNCLFYLFTTDGVDFARRRVEAYHPDGQGWHSSWLPLPDAIYDRGFSFRTREESQAAFAFRQRADELGIPRFNKQRLKKWETYRVLQRHPVLSRYLPETRDFETSQDFLQMLESHARVVLKGDAGTQGRQTMMVGKVESGFEVSSYQETRTITTTQELVTYVGSFVGRRRFLVQQAVSLLKINGKCVDYRISLAKDDRGEWTAVYNKARVGRENPYITANFCDMALTVDALRDTGLTREEAEDFDQQGRELAIEVARCLEQEFGPMGELGVDLGIDHLKRFWFFEANTQPLHIPKFERRRPFPEYVRKLQYCIYLSGFRD